jgi:hypothetical protein
MSGTTAVRVGVLTLAAVVLAVSAGALPTGQSRAAAEALAPGTDFTITTSVTSSPTSAEAGALLYPGVTRYLWYRVHNPLPQAITVTSLGLAGVQAPPSCPAANLDVAELGLTGAFVVPPATTATVLAPRPFQLRNLPVNQDACKDVTFTFTFTGTGWYSTATPQDPKDPKEPPPPPDPGPQKLGSATILTAGPNPAAVGHLVSLTAQVARTTPSAPGSTSASALPSGTVSFHLRTTAGSDRLLGTIPLDAQGSATLRLADLPPGSGTVFAVYAGTETFAGSTSALVSQTIIAPPAACTATYATSILGRPDSPVIAGTAGNDFIYAVGGNYRVRAGRGNDCIVLGDGTNMVWDGSGADVVLAGHGRNTIRLTGSRNTVVLGDGSGSRITVVGTKQGKRIRFSSDNRISLGDGSANRVTIRKGSRNVLTIGDGSRNRVVIGKGTRNAVTIGDGTRNRVTVRGTKAQVTLGVGQRNRVIAARPGSRATCVLPAPPASWRGTPARYYGDRFVRCRVVAR